MTPFDVFSALKYISNMNIKNRNVGISFVLIAQVSIFFRKVVKELEHVCIHKLLTANNLLKFCAELEI